MFLKKDSAIATKFSIQSNKMSYVASHGLEPYFKKKMLDDVKKVDKTTKTKNNWTYCSDIGVMRNKVVVY